MNKDFETRQAIGHSSDSKQLGVVKLGNVSQRDEWKH